MKRILIMDDEPKFLEPIIEKLESNDLPYKYVQYFEELIIELEGENSCLSLDLLTNENDKIKYNDNPVIGLNILRQVRESYPKLPIVCYTVLNDQNVINEIENYGAVYISKSKKTDFPKLFEFFNKHQNGSHK